MSSTNSTTVDLLSGIIDPNHVMGEAASVSQVDRLRVDVHNQLTRLEEQVKALSTKQSSLTQTAQDTVGECECPIVTLVNELHKAFPNDKITSIEISRLAITFMRGTIIKFTIECTRAPYLFLTTERRFDLAVDTISGRKHHSDVTIIQIQNILRNQ